MLGTPAEEGGGGKIHLIERGGFEGVDVAMMVHPGPIECVVGFTNARAVLNIEFTGKAAHAAAFPWEGVNALDAAVLSYTNISVLRQQMKPTWRVHAIITNGGVKPNIIPEKSALECFVRAPNKIELQQLKEKVVACFEAAAKASSCTVEVKDIGKIYENVLCNPILSKLYESNYLKLGMTEYQYSGDLTSSTDFGNASQIIPGIQPRYLVGDGVATHSPPFAEVANTPEAHNKTILVAKCLAMTCVDVLIGGEHLMKEIRQHFIAQTGTQ